MDRALDSANEAQKAWQATGLEQKQNVLMAIGNTLMERAAELGELLSREEGKPLAEGKGEVFRAGQFFTYYAAEVLRQIGDTADSVRPGVEVDVRREPVGTVAIISPWNFPTATAVWKIAPALAFGNSVIWKPANLVPASAVALAEIIAGQDIPKGLVQSCYGSWRRSRPAADRKSRLSTQSALPVQFRSANRSPQRPSKTSPRCKWRWVPRTRLP